MISAERKKRVLYLYHVKRKSTREVAKIERMSLRDVDRTLKEDRGEKVSWTNEKVKDNSKNFAAMNRLFMKHISPVQVSIDLNVSLEIVLPQYLKYLIATKLGRVVRSYEEKGDAWLDDVNEVNNAIEKLGLKSESALGLLKYAWKMQEAGYSLQRAKEEEAAIDLANWKQALHMSNEKQEHEKRISELQDEEKKITNRTQPAKIKPEKTKNVNQSSGNEKFIDEEKLQTLLNSIAPLARKLNPYEK